MIKITPLVLFILLGFNAWAQVQISQIQVRGNKKTKAYIIKNEAFLPLNKPITRDEIKASVKRIKNLNLFSSVKAGIKTIQNKKILIYFVKEKWTTIPILNFSSGGGIKKTSAGVFDPNLFGHFLEGGFKYEKLNDQESYSLWTKAPRITQNIGFSTAISQFNRERIKFDQKQDDPIIENSFTQNRKALNFNFSYRYNYKTSLSAFHEYNDDRFPDGDNLEISSPEGKRFITSRSQVNFIGLKFQSGLSLQSNELVNKNIFGAQIKYGFVKDDVVDNFYQLTASYNFAKSFGRRHNIVQRFLAGATDTQLLQYWTYLGGLDRIRGFADNRFSGRFFWLSNSEYRYSVIKNKKVILQAATFLDIGNAKDQLSGYEDISGASTGIGIRIHLPQVYNFLLRFDYAQPLIKDDENQFSFGVRQFF